MFHSNVQNAHGGNNRQQHETRREAYKRVFNAGSAAGKTKQPTIYYARRQYTIVL